ncbi:MAG: NAD(P)-dependent oxidoreductase, partial [Halanaerobiales bacterium]
MAKTKALLMDTYDTIEQETVRDLEEEFATINFYKAQKEDENFTTKLKKANIIYGVPGQEEIKKAQNLQWLQLESAGVDRYLDRDLYKNKDVILTNASGVYGLPISEHILSLILAFNRRLHLHITQKNDHVWQGHRVKKDFAGSVLGIIGLGDIGKALARRASALGCEILAVKNNPRQKPEYVKELSGPEGLNRVLKKSDFVVLALPLTEKTKKIIGQKEL